VLNRFFGVKLWRKTLVLLKDSDPLCPERLSVCGWSGVLCIEDKLYIVMELIEGATLAEHFASLKEKQQKFSESRIWNIFLQVSLCSVNRTGQWLHVAHLYLTDSFLSCLYSYMCTSVRAFRNIVSSSCISWKSAGIFLNPAGRT